MEKLPKMTGSARYLRVSEDPTGSFSIYRTVGLDVVMMRVQGRVIVVFEAR
jgi:hypothetical protein